MLSIKKLNAIINILKSEKSLRYASNILDSLATDYGFYDDIRDYNMGEFCPVNLVVDSLRDTAANEDKYDAKLDNHLANETEKNYGNDNIEWWLDFDTLQPISTKDVITIIKDVVMFDVETEREFK